MSSLNADGNAATGSNAKVTNGKVNVTINCDSTYLSGNNTLQYSIGENNWQTIKASEVSNGSVTKETSVNGNVYARYYDGSIILNLF